MVANSIAQLTRRFLDWHLKPSDSPNFDFLDGLRGMAVLLVVVAHLVYTNPASSVYVRFVGALFGTGGWGVSLFFALSGFLVSLPFWRRKFAKKGTVIPTGYVQRRFFKIYPPLALTLFIFTPIYYYQEPDLGYWVAAAEWLTGAAVVFPVDGRLNPVMWSLSVEVQFYIMLPLVMLLFREVSMARSVWMVPLLFAAIGFGCRLAFAAFGLHGTIHPMIFSPLFSGLDQFALGVLVAGLSTMGLVKKPWAKAGNIAVLVLAVLLPLKAYVYVTRLETEAFREVADLVLHIAIGCMLCFLGDGNCFMARLLCNPLLRCFGIISFEWYLVHQALFVWIRAAIGHANGNVAIYLLIVGGSFLTSLLLAALVYKYFSLPILKYGRNRH
jgi:peptidoglycan/LPS O-acetylase OafA/YrhL